MIILFIKKSIKSVLKFANIICFGYNIFVDFIFYFMKLKNFLNKLFFWRDDSVDNNWNEFFENKKINVGNAINNENIQNIVQWNNTQDSVDVEVPDKQQDSKISKIKKIFHYKTIKN